MTNRRAPQRLAILISGVGSTMNAVLAATRAPGFGVEVVVVIADRDAAGLETASQAGIATQVIRPADFPDRAEWDIALADAVAAAEPDLVLLAGFMRIVGRDMLERFGGRILNTHPSLLPSFPGAHGVRDALAAGVKITGCTVMVVDAGVDTGPIVAQAAVEVWEDDSETSLQARIKAVERDLVVTTVGRMARDGWQVDGRDVKIGRSLRSDRS